MLISDCDLRTLVSAMSGWGGCSRALLALLALGLATASASVQKKRKPISTALNAKWSQTPFVLEAAEYLNSENPDFFWTFVSDVSEIVSWPTLTASEQHEAVVRLASKSLTAAQVKLLQFSLSLRTESPKVEMYSHLASDRGVPGLGCSVVFETGGKLSCELPAPVQSEENVDLYDIDHIYPR